MVARTQALVLMCRSVRKRVRASGSLGEDPSQRGAYPMYDIGAGEVAMPPSTPERKTVPKRIRWNRTLIASARVSEADLAEWRSKATAAGVPLSELLRTGDGAVAHLDRTWPQRSSGSAPASWRGSART